MAAVAQSTTTPTTSIDPFARRGRKQPPPHVLVYPQMATWLAIAEPDAHRDRLAKSYIEETARHKAMARREPELIARIKTVSREIAGPDGSNTARFIKEQASLNAELAIVADLRVDAAHAHITATNELGAELERQIRRDGDAATDAISETSAERQSLQRIIDTLPKPDRHDEARARLAEIAAQLAPIKARRQTCEQAFRVARMMQYDKSEAAQVVARAWKG